MKYIMEKLI